VPNGDCILAIVQMGHVTVLIQHAWKMQNSRVQYDGIPISYKIDRVARLGGLDAVPFITPLAARPLIAHVRINTPSSIAQLVSYYNACQINNEISECEVACFDVLLRLEKLILPSAIPDMTRQTHYKLILKRHVKPKGLLLPKESKKTAQLIKIKEPTQSKETNRKTVAEARISLLILARCRSIIIRDHSLILLCEALETNNLDTSEHEIMHLQMLWVELVHLMRQILDFRKKHSVGIQSDTGSNFAGKSDYSIDSFIENALDGRILVDPFFQKLLVVSLC
jgi:hypothetical protein